MVQGAEATDGHRDNSGSVSDASPFPCGTCPVCPLAAALEEGPATAGNGQWLPCFLAAAAFWGGEAAADSGPDCPLVVAMGGGEGRGCMTQCGCGSPKKEGWRVMGAETQLGKEMGGWGDSDPEDTARPVAYTAKNRLQLMQCRYVTGPGCSEFDISFKGECPCASDWL